MKMNIYANEYVIPLIKQLKNSKIQHINKKSQKGLTLISYNRLSNWTIWGTEKVSHSKDNS